MRESWHKKKTLPDVCIPFINHVRATKFKLQNLKTRPQVQPGNLRVENGYSMTTDLLVVSLPWQPHSFQLKYRLEVILDDKCIDEKIWYNQFQAYHRESIFIAYLCVWLWQLFSGHPNGKVLTFKFNLTIVIITSCLWTGKCLANFCSNFTDTEHTVFSLKNLFTSVSSYPEAHNNL